MDEKTPGLRAEGLDDVAAVDGGGIEGSEVPRTDKGASQFVGGHAVSFKESVRLFDRRGSR